MLENKNRKIIVSDLDGTLLRNDETISDYTVKTIKKLSKLGHIFCIATGRPIRSAIKFYEQLGLKTIMANLNGSIISNPSDKNFLTINLTFSKDIIQELISDKQLMENIGSILIENIDGAYIGSGISQDITQNSRVKKEFLNKFHLSTKDVVKVFSWKDKNFLKRDINSVLLYVKNKDTIDQITFKIKSFTNTLIVRNWSLPSDDTGTVIEINSIFSSKGTFVKFLSSYYAIPMMNCYTFGDGENDIEMIKKSNGYAMKNGSHVAKLMSRLITSYDNENDGVAKELSQIFNL